MASKLVGKNWFFVEEKRAKFEYFLGHWTFNVHLFHHRLCPIIIVLFKLVDSWFHSFVSKLFMQSQRSTHFEVWNTKKCLISTLFFLVSRLLCCFWRQNKVTRAQPPARPAVDSVANWFWKNFGRFAKKFRKFRTPLKTSKLALFIAFLCDNFFNF